MRRIILIAIAAVALVGIVFAQATGSDQNSTSANPSAATTQTPATASPAGGAAPSSAVAEGTAINAELAKGVDAKKAKENDQIQAKVTQDVLVGGKVVVPRNSKLLGHVTQVKAGGKGESSSLGIAFDKAVLKGGQEVPLHGVIQALAPAVRMPGAMAPPGGDDMSGPAPTGGGGYNTSAGGGGMAAPRTGPQGVGGGSQQPASPAGSMGSPEGAGDAPGMSINGQLTSASRGVMGMPGVMLNAGEGGSGSVLTNEKKTVKLDSGTQMVVRVTAQ